MKPVIIRRTLRKRGVQTKLNESILVMLFPLAGRSLTGFAFGPYRFKMQLDGHFVSYIKPAIR